MLEWLFLAKDVMLIFSGNVQPDCQCTNLSKKARCIYNIWYPCQTRLQSLDIIYIQNKLTIANMLKYYFSCFSKYRYNTKETHKSSNTIVSTTVQYILFVKLHNCSLKTYVMVVIEQEIPKKIKLSILKISVFVLFDFLFTICFFFCFCMLNIIV